jgi:predicted PurR-regulated permease PerM
MPTGHGAASTPATTGLRRVLIAVGAAVAAIVFILLVRAVADVLLLLFAGVLLAVLLRTLSGVVARRTPLSDGWSLALVVLASVVLLGFGGWRFAPALVAEFDGLAESLPRSVAAIEEWLNDSAWGRSLLDELPEPGALVEPSRVLPGVRGLFSTTLGALAALIVLLFVGLYLAIEPQNYRRGLVSLIPPSRRARAEQVLEELGRVLRGWLLAKLLAMVVIGLLTTLGLWALGVPLAVGLGVIAGLLSFIPNIGPVLSAVPAVLVGLADSPWRAVQVGALFLGIQIVESYGLTPYVERRAIALPPALVMGVQLMLGVLVGAIGVVLAAPLVAVGIVLVRMLYVEDVLGDRSPPAES